MIDKRAGSITTVISSGALHHSHGGAYMALRPNSREVPYQPAKAAILTRGRPGTGVKAGAEALRKYLMQLYQIVDIAAPAA